MKHMKALLAVAISATTVSLAGAEISEAAKKDLALVQGEWTMVSGSADGQPMPEEMRKQMKRVCKSDETTTTMGDRIFLKAKFVLDPSRHPKTIDYQVTDGFTKGKTQLGIYEVEGDTFKSCFASPGAERPKEFTGNPGEGHTVSVWKRNKPSPDTK